LNQWPTLIILMKSKYKSLCSKYTSIDKHLNLFYYLTYSTCNIKFKSMVFVKIVWDIFYTDIYFMSMILVSTNNYSKQGGIGLQLDKYSGYLNFKGLSAYLFTYI